MAIHIYSYEIGCYFCFFEVYCQEKGDVIVRAEMSDKWIGIDDAAEYLGVNKDTIRNWIKNPQSEIPAHKIGLQWKLKISELDAWIKSGKSSIN